MKKPPWDTIAIVGVGLIGGSIGLAIGERGLAKRVIGIGRRSSSLQKAKDRGAVTETTLDLAEGVREAQLIIVCTPIADIVATVKSAAAACASGALMTDAGSTKAQIVRGLRRLPNEVHFVGSHPMAGSERKGPEHAQADLFEGRPVIVTPTRATREQDRRALKRFWSALGGRVVEMTPAEHDRAVAAVSHLPHLVAALLAASTPEGDLPLVSSGWLDATRIAAGDVELWRQIITSNRAHALRSLGRFEKLIVSLHDALERGDDAQLQRILSEAKRKRDAVGN